MSQNNRCTDTTEKETNMKEQIEVAVNWWAEQLANGTRQDNGDAMTAVLMHMLDDTIKPPTAEQIRVFKETLTKLLSNANERQLRMGIYNDYHADPLLCEAATAAGIVADCPPFPIKTCLWIRPEVVSVRHGYGAPEKVLWGAHKAAA